MIRRMTVALALACVSLAMFSSRVLAQLPAEPPIIPDTPAVIAVLKQTMDTKGFVEPMKLKRAIELISDKFGGRLQLLIDVEACRANLDDPTFDPYNVDFILPETPTRITLNIALQIMANQACKGEGTFFIRQGFVEIVPASHATARLLLKRPLVASFDRKPLPEVLRELSDLSGLAINLDPNIGKKTEATITATFRGNCFEDSLVTVTEMAELKFVVLFNSVYVTTASKVEAVEKEEKKRQEKRDAVKVKSTPKS